MTYRGISYDVVRATDIDICWRWILIMNGRRKSGQTKISRRAAEIQARNVIDSASRQSDSKERPPNAAKYQYREDGADRQH
jgi:hypothetical protein